MRKFLIIVIFITLAVSAGITYLNRVLLPVKLKAVIVRELESAVKKKIILGSVQFSVFKGLVLKDLIIRDDSNAIINVKEARCAFLILPLFDRQIIISRFLFISPDIFIERRADNSINILELFPKPDGARGSGFNALIRKVIIRGATVNFHDLTTNPLYTKEIKGLNAELYFQLPAKVKYEARFDIMSDSPINVNLSGEYFSGALNVDADFKTMGLKLSNGKISVNLSGSARVTASYNFDSKKLDYTGDVNILDMTMTGIEYAGRIDGIKGRIEFSNLGLSSDNMTAIAFGLPMDVRIKVDDFNNPVIDIEASSDVELSYFQDILKTNFGLDVPADFEGNSKLSLEIRYPVSSPGESRIKGSLYMLSADIVVNGGAESIKSVTGRVDFFPNQISWEDVGFRYRDIHYKSSGALTNFKTPGIQLKLSSKDISVETVFALNGKVGNFSKFSGKYLNSAISAAGSIDMSDPAKLTADIAGSLNVDIDDLKEPLGKFKDKLRAIKPEGRIRAEFSLKGDLKNIMSCAIDAKCSSERLSLYGFSLERTTMNYAQKNEAADILFMRSFLYGGSMGATGKIEWASKDVPYRFDVDIDGMKIEKFKADTNFKDKDIAGSIKLKAKIRGLFGNIDKLSGEGKIEVTEGKLWQLNLLKGLGTLLFTSDFGNIIFKEGHCDFTIADKTIFTDEITLESGLVDIYGPMKIGFDKSLSATLKAEFSDDAIQPGARRNIAAAIGKFTQIDMAGTLKDPQYKISADVQSIAESFAERFSGE